MPSCHDTAGRVSRALEPETVSSPPCSGSDQSARGVFYHPNIPLNLVRLLDTDLTHNTPRPPDNPTYRHTHTPTPPHPLPLVPQAHQGQMSRDKQDNPETGHSSCGSKSYHGTVRQTAWELSIATALVWKDSFQDWKLRWQHFLKKKKNWWAEPHFYG